MNSTVADLDENSSNLSRSDYVFAYSMLLHYGCVVRFNKDIQRASQSLSAGEQLAVTVFLNYFLSRNVLVTRPSLCSAIREAIHSLDAGPLAKFYAEDENGNRGETFNNNTTPKTVKLEQNNREIFKLRGQVHTVGFEMAYLEGLVRERDTQIDNSKKREADLQREIDELKKMVLYRATDGDDLAPAHAIELARKERLELRTLRKSNALLEDKVANLLIESNHAGCDKAKMIGKLKANAKDLKIYKERTAELSTLIEEMNAEVAVKNQQISELIETNMELEAFITENRSLLNKNIESMNTSSFSGASSTATTASPNTSATNLLRSANLGSCVIDIQLKEKELENVALKKQLNSLNDSTLSIGADMARFLEEHTAIKDQLAEADSLCGGEQVDNVLQRPDVFREFFQAVTHVLREKTQLEGTIQAQCTVLVTFREERDQLKEDLLREKEKSAAMEKELSELRETVKSYAEAERRELDTFKYEVKHLNDLMTVQKLEKESFKSAIEKGEEDLYAKVKRIGKLNLVIERLRFEKKRAENEHKEAEANLNQLLELKVEEGRVRQQDWERKFAEQENVLAIREKHVALLEEKMQQMGERGEESERRWLEREEEGKREVLRWQETVQKLEADVAVLRRENATMETKMRIVSNNFRPSLSLDVDKMRGALDSESDGAGKQQQRRRSSLCTQLTSTPRLSMKQKVRMDVELLKRRRISILSPDDRMTSSESDNVASADLPCICKPAASTSSGGSGNKAKGRVTRRDSLIYNSPCRKRRSSYARQGSGGHFDRSAINRMQKQKRQKVFNKARQSLKEPELPGSGAGQLESLMWDGQYDLGDLAGGEEFAAVNDDAMLENFHAILETERCDGEDLFGNEDGGEEKVIKEEEEEDKEKTGERQAIVEESGQGQHLAVTTPMTRSFDRSGGGGGSAMQSRSYSINSGVYWGNERIPTPAVVHISPRGNQGAVALHRGKWNLNLIPMSAQNLLQLIAILLIGIFVCVFYQNVLV